MGKKQPKQQQEFLLDTFFTCFSGFVVKCLPFFTQKNIGAQDEKYLFFYGIANKMKQHRKQLDSPLFVSGL